MRQDFPFSWCNVLKISEQFWLTIFEFSYFFTSEDKWTLFLGPCREGKLSLTPSFSLQKGGTPLTSLMPWHWLAPLVRGEFHESERPGSEDGSSLHQQERGLPASPGGGLANFLAHLFLRHSCRLAGSFSFWPQGWVCQHSSLSLGWREKEQGWDICMMYENLLSTSLAKIVRSEYNYYPNNK